MAKYSSKCSCGMSYDRPRSEGGRCTAVPSCDDFRKPGQARISREKLAAEREQESNSPRNLLSHDDAVASNLRLFGPSFGVLPGWRQKRQAHK